jgi:hypothetical protein
LHCVYESPGREHPIWRALPGVSRLSVLVKNFFAMAYDPEVPGVSRSEMCSIFFFDVGVLPRRVNPEAGLCSIFFFAVGVLPRRANPEGH